MKIYINSDFKCHTTKPGGVYAEVETDFFDGKCTEFVKGYRFIPQGESWTREDGTVFIGERFPPWKPYSELDAAQRQYEREQAADMQAALEILGVTVDE